MTNKMYDILKWMVQIVIPACATLYAALAALWGFPYVEQVVGTLSAIAVFLGTVLKISSDRYSGDGSITVDTDNDDYTVDLQTALEDIVNEKSITIKVNK